MAVDADTLSQLLDTVGRFVDERLRPLEAAVDAEDRVPDEVVEEMRALGLFGLTIPESYGGLGLDVGEEVRVAMVLGRTSPAFRSVFGTNVGIGKSSQSAQKLVPALVRVHHERFLLPKQNDNCAQSGLVNLIRDSR